MEYVRRVVGVVGILWKAEDKVWAVVGRPSTAGEAQPRPLVRVPFPVSQWKECVLRRFLYAEMSLWLLQLKKIFEMDVDMSSVVSQLKERILRWV